MKFSGLVAVHSIIHISETVFTLKIKCPQIASRVKPGQFIQLKLYDSGLSLWPRPFSIHRVEDEVVTITVKKCGKVTGEMAGLKPGDTLHITGPLGNSFKLPSRNKSIYLVAGGVGLPPLHLLCESILKDGRSPQMIHFYSGALSAGELFANEEIKGLDVNYTVTTDDGSAGIQGFITEPLAMELAGIRTGGNPKNAVIYSCGPLLMLKKVAEICDGFECYLSLEQLMPCGWGVCNGCAVKVRITDDTETEDEREFRLARVCKEGPVFNASEVIWE